MARSDANTPATRALLARLTAVALTACAAPSPLDATSTSVVVPVVTSATLGEITETTRVPASATTTTTAAAAAEPASAVGYPDSWVNALVDAANQDEFGSLEGYLFASVDKRGLFRVFVEADMPTLAVTGACEDVYRGSGCLIGSDDGQSYWVELDLDNGGLFKDLTVRALIGEELASDGAFGSGCSPGPGPLPDGIWFGYIAARRSDAIDFDLACLFPDPSVDVQMVNTSSVIRTLAVDPGALVTQLSDSDFPASGTLYRDWGEWCPITGTCPVWIRIVGGRVIYIAQEFYS